MVLRRHVLVLGAAAALALGGLTPALAAGGAPIKVVASFSILGDMVKEVAGDSVELTILVGPDGDAHVYEPTPADAKSVGEADVLIVNGLGFEGWMPRLLGAAGFKGKMVVASDGITPREWAGEEDEHAEAGDAAHAHEHDEHGAFDPHAWQSLTNGVAYIDNIVAALSAADPAHAETYKAKGAAYVATLQALDAKLKKDFGAIPAERRKIVTSHDAFGYFGAAYGIEFIAPQGVSTDADASAGDVAAIIRQIRDEKITAVFVENITNPRLVEQIARETGARVGGELYSDALSPADGPAPTYAKMFEFNDAALTAALSGS